VIRRPCRDGLASSYLFSFSGDIMVLDTGVAVSKQKLSDLKVRLLALKEHL
jgi:hypothetical protein